jgi:16S rRNA (uracil1498-N3)-methyltransferase
VGCDAFIPIECMHSERRTLKHERAEKVITSAVKQSLKAYHPELEQMTNVREVIAREFAGRKLIAHCREDIGERVPVDRVLEKGDDILMLIGPEGDFSREEVELALANGFTPVSLGEARLRTETAALAAVMFCAYVNMPSD